MILTLSHSRQASSGDRVKVASGLPATVRGGQATDSLGEAVEQIAADLYITAFKDISRDPRVGVGSQRDSDCYDVQETARKRSENSYARL
jgi:hypothetical protein